MKENEIKKIKKAINQIIREKNRFPTLLEMCGLLNFSKSQTYKYMESLTEDGFLEKKGDWFKYPEKKKDIIIKDEIKWTEEPSFKKEEKIIEVKEPPPVKKRGRPKKKKFEDNPILYGVPIYVIQFIMGLIGIGAAIISIYYTTIWLLEFLPWGFALLLSSIMVGFSITAFEAVILFMTGQVTKSQTAKTSIVSSFIILWLIVTSFSIVSTVAGQYNKHIENLQEESKSGIDIANTEWNLIQEKKKDLRERIKGYKGQLASFDKIADGINTIELRKENQGTWREIQYRIKVANSEIDKLSKELKEAYSEEKHILKDSREKGIVFTGKSEMKRIPNFYGWLSGVLDMKEDLVQFFLSLFPAIFVDVISPVGIAIALFLRSKYRRPE